MKDRSSAIGPFQFRDFRFYLSARFLSLVAHMMMLVSVSQAVYEVTHNTLYLGLVGLSIFIPKFSFTLLAGHVADRYDRRTVMLICRVAEWIIILAILAYYLSGIHSLPLLLSLIFLIGTAYAFDGPSSQALMTQLVPASHFQSAVTWNSTFFQISFILGPALGGWLYALLGKASLVIAVVALFRLLSAVLVVPIQPRRDHIETSELSWKVLMAGIRYVVDRKILLGVISLDLFAVLLGGAVALMPVYANDILHVGPKGLGILRAAPAMGAAFMALIITRFPPSKKSGPIMLSCVAIFGVMTILFGLSKNFIFSIFCLTILGAADMVSVVIRHVLVQVMTPQSMRGRVSAVNLIFIGASNELGEFESGLTASWFGTIPAVVIGGIGTLLVVSLWAWKFPEIRKFDRLEAS